MVSFLSATPEHPGKAAECRSLTDGSWSCSAVLGVRVGRRVAGEEKEEGGEGMEMCSATKPKTSKLKVIIIRKPTENLQVKEGQFFTS